MDQSKPQVNIGGLRPVDWNRVFDEPASPKEEKPVESESSEEGIIQGFKTEFGPVIEGLMHLKRAEYQSEPSDEAGILTRAEQRLASRRYEYEQTKQEAINKISDFIGHYQEKLINLSQAGRTELWSYVNDEFEKAGREVFNGVRVGPTEELWEGTKDRILHIINLSRIAEGLNRGEKPEAGIAPGIEIKGAGDSAVNEALPAEGVEMTTLRPEPATAPATTEVSQTPVAPQPAVNQVAEVPVADLSPTVPATEPQAVVSAPIAPQVPSSADPNVMRADLEQKISDAKVNALNSEPEAVAQEQGNLAEKKQTAAAESNQAIQNVENNIAKTPDQPAGTTVAQPETQPSIAEPILPPEQPKAEQPKKKGLLARLFGSGNEEIDSSQAAQLTKEAQERSSAPAPEEKTGTE